MKRGQRHCTHPVAEDCKREPGSQSCLSSYPPKSCSSTAERSRHQRGPRILLSHSSLQWLVGVTQMGIDSTRAFLGKSGKGGLPNPTETGLPCCSALRKCSASSHNPTPLIRSVLVGRSPKTHESFQQRETFDAGFIIG